MSDLEREVDEIANEIDDDDRQLTKARKKKQRPIEEQIKEVVEKPISRDKKPRSEAQQKAFEKARAMRTQRLEEKKLAREEEKRKKEEEDKIVKKVKQRKAEPKVEYQQSDDNTTSESESEEEYVPPPKSKKKKKVVMVEKPKKKKKKSVKVYLSSSSDESESESEEEYVPPKKSSKSRIKRNVDTIVNQDTPSSDAKVDYRNYFL
jgi:hypothetical protein